MASTTSDDDGPKYKVPRLVWRLAWLVMYTAGMIPILIVSMHIGDLENSVHPYAEPDLVQIFAFSAVFATYAWGVIQGVRKAMAWLFGPIPARRGDRAPIS